VYSVFLQEVNLKSLEDSRKFTKERGSSMECGRGLFFRGRDFVLG